MRLAGTAFVKVTPWVGSSRETWVNLAQVKMILREGRMTILKFDGASEIKVKETPDQLLSGGAR